MNQLTTQKSVRFRKETLTELEKFAEELERLNGLRPSTNMLVRAAVYEFLDKREGHPWLEGVDTSNPEEYRKALQRRDTWKDSIYLKTQGRDNMLVRDYIPSKQETFEEFDQLEREWHEDDRQAQ
jgi:hypothetical protein